MATRVDQIQSLIEGIQQSDPRLYTVLKALTASVTEIQNDLFPLQEAIGAVVAEPFPADPQNMAYTTNGLVLSITWTGNSRFYELRKGQDWNTSPQVTVVGVQEVRLDPIPVGTTYYLLKGLNSSGQYSTNAASLAVIIGPIGSITVTGQVIDNNILLSWSPPVSVWNIDYYIIERNNSVIGTQKGTFFTYFEVASGTFTYSITPVDIAGDQGPASAITLVVAQPPDFELEDFRVSLLDGTKANALITGSPELGWRSDDIRGWLSIDGLGWEAANTGKILVCIDITETWEQHFIEGDT